MDVREKEQSTCASILWCEENKILILKLAHMCLIKIYLKKKYTVK